MNKAGKVKRENIEEKTDMMKYCLKYFADWEKAVGEMKEEKKVKEKFFVAQVTYKNLRMMVVGFLSYCREVLFNVDNPVAYVPFLHSNQSSIEATFSMVRANNSDNPRSFGKCLCLHEIRKQVPHLQRLQHNPMYMGEVLENESDLINQNLSDRALGRASNHRVSKLTEMVDIFFLRRRSRDLLVAAFDFQIDENHQNRHLPSLKCSSILNSLKDKKLQSHYSIALFRHDSTSQLFRDSIQASIGTPTECFFCSLFEFDKTNECNFNQFCQATMQSIFDHFSVVLDTKGLAQAKNSLQFNHYEHCCTYLFTMQVEYLPIQTRHRTVAFWIFQLLSRMFLTWVQDLLDDQERKWNSNEQMDDSSAISTISRLESSPKSSQEQEGQELQRYVGFGVKKVIDTHKQQLQNYKKRGQTKQYNCILQVLKGMRVLHADVFESTPEMEEYMSKYYPSFLKVFNHGGLTLVAPVLVPFGLKLMSLIRLYVREEHVFGKGEKVLVEARKEILNDKSLRLIFWNGMKEIEKNAEHSIDLDNNDEDVLDSNGADSDLDEDDDDEIFKLDVKFLEDQFWILI